MLDPLPPPPAVLAHLTAPLARLTNLTTLPLHIHEVLGAFVVYQSINLYFSPIFSRTFFGKHYNALSHRTRLNWDVHVVSFVQSVVISGLALWVMWVDKERSTMEWQARVHGYTGAGGMLQGFAAGYFLWDLWVCVRHLDVFGWGMLAHAVSALVVFSLGFVSVFLSVICFPGNLWLSPQGRSPRNLHYHLSPKPC
jgi:heme/copper-type cytochrome/quinol oxidase subunit 4